MPLATYDDVKDLLPAALRKPLERAAVFARYELSAAIMVRDATGIVIPEDEADAPDWVRQPMAWIIAYVASELFQSKSPELVQSLRDNYNAALSLLKSHKMAVSPGRSAASSGSIEGGW